MTYLIALIMFYTGSTGHHPSGLITDNWLSEHWTPFIVMRHNVQYGDINGDCRTNMLDWAEFAKGYKPIGYTVGGKIHLYRDCGYIKDKQAMPILVDGNDICLACAKRRIAE